MIRRLAGRSTTHAVLLALLLGASACGVDHQPQAVDGPSDDHDQRVSGADIHAERADTTPSATPTRPPLSSFEGTPQVKALRAWAAAAVRDVNARREDFPLAQVHEVDTFEVRNDVGVSFQEEFDKYFPGPLPFTPVAVKRSGDQTVISTCVIGSGFALTKRGGPPAEKLSVVPVAFTMARQGSRWLLAGILAGSGRCDRVTVQPRLWSQS